MGKTKQFARKTLALLSTSALLLTCGATGIASNVFYSGITVNAAQGNFATQLKVLDENGNDLGDSPVIYLDTSEAGGEDAVYHNVSRTIRVVASNDNGIAVNDEVQFFAENDADNYVEINCPQSGSGSITATLEGGYSDTDGWVEKNPGTTHLYFTTSSGEVYRTVTVIVYRPASDMEISVVSGSSSQSIELGENNLDNSATVMAIANRKYQFSATMIPDDSTDEVEWAVCEGSYEGKDGETFAATNKAEITDDGLFTPKTNGMVTVVAKCKATETTDRLSNLGEKTLNGDGDEEIVLKNYKNIPKYIHVLIVKENPAKALRITNAPEAMEINKSLQLKYVATPTYTDDGYDTGVTDQFVWESSNTDVIQVDEKGLITAVGKGDAKITIYADNRKVFAEANIKVITKATSISFRERTLTTRVGKTIDVTAIMSPDSADEEIVWSTSNSKIATVKSNVEGEYTSEQTATVRGIAKGVVTITARAKNSGVEANIICNVEEKIVSSDVLLNYEKGDEIVSIQDGDTVIVYDQNNITVSGSLVSAEGASPDDTIKWTVTGNGANNGDYVDITEMTGSQISMTGFARGTIQVTASSEANPEVKKTFNLKVLRRATEGSIFNRVTKSQEFHRYMNVGSYIKLGAELRVDSNQPFDHDDKISRWTTSNDKVATVDSNGYVKAVGNGSAEISVYTESGMVMSTSFTVFTTSRVVLRGVEIDPNGGLPYTEIILDNELSGMTQLSADVFDERGGGVYDTAVVWSSDNEAVATVDSEGRVTARMIGNAKISAKSGNKTDTCIVHVRYNVYDANIVIPDVSYSPNTTEYCPKVTVYAGDSEGDVQEILTEGTDYRVVYSNNTKVGDEARVEIIGMGNYNQTVYGSFMINPRNITDSEVVFTPIKAQELSTSNTNGACPSIVLKHDGVTLKKNVDYTVEYYDNYQTGTASVTVFGMGNYTGEFTAHFKVYCTHKHAEQNIIEEATCTSKGRASVYCNACGKSFEIELPVTDHAFEQTEVVEPTYTKDGYTVYTCYNCGITEHRDYVPALRRIPGSYCTVKADNTVFVADGSVKHPELNISYNGTSLWENDDYSITYSNKYSKSAGSYKITISYKGRFTGTASVNYTILPTAASVTTNPETLKLKVGEKSQIKASSVPEASIAAVEWISSNSGVVEVSENGKITAVSEGTAEITAIVGNVSGTCVVTVSSPAFTNASALTESTIVLGSSTSIAGVARGGKSPYQYAYYYKTESETSYTTIKGYSTNTVVDFTPKATGKYDVRVKIKDSNGKVVNKDLELVVDPVMKNTSKLSSTSIMVGEVSDIICSVNAGCEPYEFEAVYQKENTKTWTTIQEYGPSSIISFVPSSSGNYTIKVRAMDSNGTVSVKSLKLTVVKKLTNKSTVSTRIVTLGSKSEVTCAAAGGNTSYQYQVDYKKSGASSWTSLQSYSDNTTVNFKPSEKGFYVVRVIVKDSKGRTVTSSFNVRAVEALANNSVVVTSKIIIGADASIKCKASGGTEQYQYAVYYKLSSETSWTTAQAYSVNNQVSFLPKKSGTYNIRTKVKDSSGKIVTKDLTLKVLKVLSNATKISAEKITTGNELTITCKGTGGLTSYQYAVFYRKSGSENWLSVQKYSTNAEVKFKPSAAGTYELLTKVKDSNGKIAEKQFTFKVVDKLVNKSTVSVKSIKINNPVKIKCAASGGEGFYKYAVSYKKTSATNYTSLQSYYANPELTFTPKTATTYDLMVKVKDASGSIVTKKFTLTATK